MESHQVPTTFSQTLHNPVFRSHPGGKIFQQGVFNWEHLRHFATSDKFKLFEEKNISA